jgi:tetraacyldisaccharide 4'-kinase
MKISFLNDLIKLFLVPFVLPYTVFMFFRNKFYCWSFISVCEINAPVISVGNIQIGGTGKTPCVGYVSKYFIENKISTFILTRGYKRRGRLPIIVDGKKNDKLSSLQLGDEPTILKRRIPGIILGIDSNRCRMAQRILDIYGKGVFILDDGFQHRKISRDLDIVLIDVSRWTNVPLLFPLSSLRDVKSSLNQAHIFILTRTGNYEHDALKLEEMLRREFRRPVFYAKMLPKQYKSLDGKKCIPLEDLNEIKIATFCGLANSNHFFNMLEMLGGEIVWRRSFKDHHRYNIKEVYKIMKIAENLKASYIVMTEKDAVKICDLFDNIPDFFLYLDVEFNVQQEEEFFDILSKTINKSLSFGTDKN